MNFSDKGLPQGLSLPFEELGLRQIAYRTENGGGYIADGYARVSKRPGVMIAQNGPAATLVVAPLAEALKSSIPLVVMLQEIPLKMRIAMRFRNSTMSVCSRPAPSGRGGVHTADRVEDYVDQAFAVACSRAARSRRAPVPQRHARYACGARKAGHPARPLSA